jgi:hypothetical protein
MDIGREFDRLVDGKYEREREREKNHTCHVDADVILHCHIIQQPLSTTPSRVHAERDSLALFLSTSSLFSLSLHSSLSVSLSPLRNQRVKGMFMTITLKINWCF